MSIVLISGGTGGGGGVCGGRVHSGAGGVGIGPFIFLVGTGAMLVCPSYSLAVVLVVLALAWGAGVPC